MCKLMKVPCNIFSCQYCGKIHHEDEGFDDSSHHIRREDKQPHRKKLKSDLYSSDNRIIYQKI